MESNSNNSGLKAAVVVLGLLLLASIGYIYDETRDAFILPKPFNSWILNEDTCLWNAPVAKPTTILETNQYYSWNESIINWEIKIKE